MPNTATPKQVEFINSLKAQRDIVDLSDITNMSADESERLALANPKGYEAGVALNIARQLWETESFTKEAASKVIDMLKAAPYPSRDAKPSETPSEAPEGMHRLGDAVYKVQRSPESGRLYAKRLVQYVGDWKFEYAKGAMRNLSESTLMSLEEAKRFGQLYGVCAVCGRTLTNEVSIAEGIGPVCSGRGFAA